MRKSLFILALLLVGSNVFAASGEDFSQLSEAANSGKEVVQSTISAWLWVSALIPFALSAFLFAKVKEYQERQEEQGQYQPKVAKYASLVGAIIGGVLIMYIIYGVLGAVFFDHTFGEMWAALVTDFFSSIL